MTRKRFPDTAAEIGTPVARQLSIRTVFNVKILSVFAVRVLTGLFEPLMLIRTVINDEIHQNVHIAFFCFSNQTVHVIHCTETRVDVVIVGNVVALIRKWGAVDR